MSPRKIAVLTGTRADYDLLYWTLTRISAESEMELLLIVTGTHLEPSFGYSIDLIKSDGFQIGGIVNCEARGASPVDIAKSFSIVTSEVAKIFVKEDPDIILILGDRYEALAAASAALFTNVPIAHIHGGEVTEGAIDDQMRHAITKLSLWHFVASEDYRNRVIQLGEDKSRIWNVGALGVESILRTPKLTKAEFERHINFTLRTNNILLTVHPETASQVGSIDLTDCVMNALDSFTDLGVIITAANGDEGGSHINEILSAYSQSRINAKFIPNLGRLLYANALRHVDAVVGNSSSGILEAPSVPVATVNIGDRQKGRLRSTSIIDCPWDSNQIANAIRRALSPEFRETLSKENAIFGDGNSSAKIMEILRQLPHHKNCRKSFVDLKG